MFSKPLISLDLMKCLGSAGSGFYYFPNFIVFVWLSPAFKVELILITSSSSQLLIILYTMLESRILDTESFNISFGLIPSNSFFPFKAIFCIRLLLNGIYLLSSSLRVRRGFLLIILVFLASLNDPSRNRLKYSIFSEVLIKECLTSLDLLG